MFTIGQLAKLADMSTVTVRYYEKKGLILKPTRLANGYRHYADETINQLRFIKNAQLIGFSLAEIKELQLIKAQETLSANEVKTFVRKKINLIDQKIQTLNEIKTELNELDTLCNGKSALKDCPILKALSGDTSCCHSAVEE